MACGPRGDLQVLGELWENSFFGEDPECHKLFVENSIPPKNAFSRVKIQKSPPKIRRHAFKNFIGTGNSGTIFSSHSDLPDNQFSFFEA